MLLSSSNCLASILVYIYLVMFPFWFVALVYMFVRDCPEIRENFLIGKGHQIHSSCMQNEYSLILFSNRYTHIGSNTWYTSV